MFQSLRDYLYGILGSSPPENTATLPSGSHPYPSDSQPHSHAVLSSSPQCNATLRGAPFGTTTTTTDGNKNKAAGRQRSSVNATGTPSSESSLSPSASVVPTPPITVAAKALAASGSKHLSTHQTSYTNNNMSPHNHYSEGGACVAASSSSPYSSVSFPSAALAATVAAGSSSANGGPISAALSSTALLQNRRNEKKIALRSTLPFHSSQQAFSHNDNNNNNNNNNSTNKTRTTHPIAVTGVDTIGVSRNGGAENHGQGRQTTRRRPNPSEGLRSAVPRFAKSCSSLPSHTPSPTTDTPCPRQTTPPPRQTRLHSFAFEGEVETGTLTPSSSIAKSPSPRADCRVLGVNQTESKDDLVVRGAVSHVVTPQVPATRRPTAEDTGEALLTVPTGDSASPAIAKHVAGVEVEEEQQWSCPHPQTEPSPDSDADRLIEDEGDGNEDEVELWLQEEDEEEDDTREESMDEEDEAAAYRWRQRRMVEEEHMKEVEATFRRLLLVQRDDENENDDDDDEVDKSSEINQGKRNPRIGGGEERRINMKYLRELSWHGCPASVRGTVWRLLTGYAAPVRSTSIAFLPRHTRHHTQLSTTTNTATPPVSTPPTVPSSTTMEQAPEDGLMPHSPPRTSHPQYYYYYPSAVPIPPALARKRRDYSQFVQHFYNSMVPSIQPRPQASPLQSSGDGRAALEGSASTSGTAGLTTRASSTVPPAAGSTSLLSSSSCMLRESSQEAKVLAQLRKDLPRTQFGHQPEPEPMFTGPRIRSILRAGRPRHPPSTMDNEMFLLCSPPLDSITTPLPSPATDGAVGSSGGDARTREEHIGMAHEGSNRELGRSTTTGVESPALDSLCHSFVHHPRVQATMERVLFCWSLRHPASGYVQGMSDLLAPFLSVVLAEYACPESHSVMELLQMDPIALSHALSEEAIPESTWRGALEPDVYALSGFLLDMAQGHYTQQQAGFLAMVERMDGILKQADPTLHQHLTDIGIETVQYAFRWMTCLLMRELQPWQVLRLLDAYLSVANEEEEVAGEIGRAAVPLDLRHHTLSTTTHHHHHHHGRENSGGSQSSVGDCLQLHVFTCVALVLHFAPALMSTTEFAEALTFLQQLPTETLSSRDIDELLAETFLLKSVFDK